MLFPFTFSISVPGIMNPFSKSPDPPNDAGDPPAPVTINNPQGKQWLAVRRPHPSTLPPPVPLARKRGWQPSSPEPSPASAVTMSTRGQLNVHPKYRDFTVTPEAREEEEEEREAEFPPAKRRRTLAGTIVTSALNAALIGTAVGVTVYRLWRDRGRLPELEPPPYEQGDWIPSERPEETVPPATSSTPRGKRTRAVPTTVRRGTNRHRKARSQTKLPVSSPRLSRHSSPHCPVKPEFDFESQADQGDDVEDKMDWMGGRLAQLIEDGKKALGKEVVVLSETQEDEVDDGSGNWEEEANVGTSSGRASRSGSIRRKNKSQAPGLTSYASPLSSPPPTASPRRQQFSTVFSSHSSSALPIPGSSTHSASVDTTQSFRSFRDDSHWQSPELRDSMERARAAYLRDRK